MRRLGWLAGCVVFGLVVAACSVTTGESTTTEPLAEPRLAGSAPSTTTVAGVDTLTPLPGFVWGDIVSGNEITFDAATGRVAIFSDGTLIEFDALAEEWVVLTYSDTYQDGWKVGPLARLGGSIVYDPVNRRIVLFGGRAFMPDGFLTAWDDVWAFDPISREWMVLLEAGMTRKYNATTGEWKAEPLAGGE